MGRAIPSYQDHPRRNLHSSNTKRQGTSSDLAHLKLKEILCLATTERFRARRVGTDN
ncbi:hypothetical protein BHE74_00004247 [Ensete ventricosum]|uniref:Uncharacterized protein n=1 Tax=Ensete ventricosum TaxID=4639 RepID=A0A444FWI1_ENSVE|nr:hypothetical protein B296_00043950 [Ensete ventricosum]RWW26987.1 hypothetical protein GW17_00008605 [Ensete ventricosum]RWW86958.1 hypothetical protein BHE74_00004247 [Ensete ventricosum]RZR71327.1 hypothetical protein BHM03_00004684 [Ensete ventricosum]